MLAKGVTALTIAGTRACYESAAMFKRVPSGWQGRDRRQRWVMLFAALRLIATAIAVTLLLAHRITDHDGILIVAVSLYGCATTALVWWVPPVQSTAWSWAADALAVLALIVAGEHWRSPFYLLALTALILPATTLRFGRALAWTGAFTLAYLGVAVVTGIDWDTLETTNRLESFATHLLLPLVLGVGLAYSSLVLRRLDAEQRRSQRLALEAERRRLARELHDSAKQRLHAAHLVLSSTLRSNGGVHREDVEQAIRELEVAGAELDQSINDLRRPWGDRTLEQALRQRAGQLQAASGIPVRVTGEAPDLPPAVATHVFHIVGEAMVNAVRHSGGSVVAATIEAGHGRLTATVVDDGRGPPPEQATSHGVRSMAERAELVGGELEIGTAEGGGGTLVLLEVPLLAKERVAP